MNANKIKIAESNIGQRLDVFLAEVRPEHSRGYWQRMIQEELVQVNNQTLSASHKLLKDEIVTIKDPKRLKKVNVPIVHLDEDILVINKPAGMLSHSKGDFSSEFTVADFALDYTSDDDNNRPGIVHRLDRETSGVMVIARSTEVKKRLQKQFSNRTVQKSYLALVEGKVKDKKAKIEAPIKRNPANPKQFMASADGKEAITEFNVERSYAMHTLLELKPKTGRTHQIRVHLTYIGHPIVGDTLYGKEKEALKRMFLHAKSIEFVHPTTNKRVKYEAELPSDLQNHLETLK